MSVPVVQRIEHLVAVQAVGGSIPLGHARGGLAEWFKALVSKTSERKFAQVRILYPPLS
jgi:hypothetical protein